MTTLDVTDHQLKRNKLPVLTETTPSHDVVLQVFLTAIKEFLEG